MEDIKLDMRGLACPLPALKTRSTMLELEKNKSKSHKIIIVVDNAASRDNVMRIGKKYKYDVQLETMGNDYFINLTLS